MFVVGFDERGENGFGDDGVGSKDVFFGQNAKPLVLGSREYFFGGQVDAEEEVGFVVEIERRFLEQAFE